MSEGQKILHDRNMLWVCEARELLVESSALIQLSSMRESNVIAWSQRCIDLPRASSAETSLTIADVVYVVDAGKLKERRHNAARGMSALVEDFVSQVSSLPCKSS